MCVAEERLEASAGPSQLPGQGLSEGVREQGLVGAKGSMRDHLAFSGIRKERNTAGTWLGDR